MRVFRYYFIFICSLVLTGNLFGQVTFTTKTSATKIGKNDLLEVSYEVSNGNIEQFNDPNFRSWQVMSGPSVSSSTFITNGQKSTSMAYQFTLKPLQPGEVNVPGATAIIDGKTVNSKPVSITVTNKNTEPGSNNAGQQIPDPFFSLPEVQPSPESIYESNDGYLVKEGEDIEAKTRKNLFVLVNVSKKTCYPGEAVKAVYELYSRVNLDAHITKRPSFSGFSSIDLPDFSHSEYHIVNRNGKDYKVYPIRSVQLYPLQVGVQTLQPVEIETTVQYQKIPSPNSILPYNPYDPNNIINFPFTVKSEPVPVTVLPFPEAAKPADFNGITGEFQVQAKTEQNILALGEAGVLKLEVQGKGNWAMVQQPVINWPEGVDVFEPIMSENIDSQAVPLNGKRIYEFPYSSNKPGNLVIPSISISFFDPVKKQYQTNSSLPITITILNQSKPVNELPGNEYGGLSGVDNTQIFTDIVKIAFPVAAILLLLWLVIKNRRKKEENKQEALYKKYYNQQHKTTVQKERAEPVFVAYPNPSDYNKYSGIAAESAGTNNEKKEILMEKTLLVNEHAGVPITTSKKYFAIVKKEIQQMLEQHFQFSNGKVLTVTRQNLLDHDFNEQETKKILEMLALCEQHIYSPFDDNFDQVKCNEMVTELTGIIKNKKQ
ncbi:MAG: BatD family protein [Bacteroidota bacterium]